MLNDLQTRTLQDRFHDLVRALSARPRESRGNPRPRFPSLRFSPERAPGHLACGLSCYTDNELAAEVIELLEYSS
jgi:hypothetical protein